MRRIEQQLQRAIVDALRLGLPPEWVVAHYPAGGYRRPSEAAIFKAMGTLPGMPDIMVLGEADHGATDWFFEVKADAGRLTSAQIAMHERLRDLGFPVAVVRGLDDVFTACKQWRIPLRGARA